MKRLITFLFLAFIIVMLTINGKAQAPETRKQSLSAAASGDDIIPIGQKKGSFFLSPFYEFTSFTELELISHTNNYNSWDGEFSYDFTSDEIQEYNDIFGTEYSNSMSGIKIGYQATKGLGISGYFGVNHIHFKSYISDENTQTINTNKPALTMGLALDYHKAITDRFAAMALFSYNYCTTGSLALDNTSGEEINSSSLKTMYYEINLVLAYQYKNLLPFAGVGFTQQYVNSLHEEKILTTNDLEEDVYNFVEFDSQFRVSAFYGFAGLEYRFNKNLAIYVRGSFPNPTRVNCGLKVIL